MECVIKYRNDTTGVTISYELGSATWVVLSRLINKGDETVEGESYGLHLLTRMRCPSMLIKHEANARTEPDKYLETALTGHAEILRKCAADVLKGNFEVFEELKSVAEAERRRINKELFGSETGETV
jgi:hypothetical protein